MSMSWPAPRESARPLPPRRQSRLIALLRDRAAVRVATLAAVARCHDVADVASALATLAEELRTSTDTAVLDPASVADVLTDAAERLRAVSHG